MDDERESIEYHVSKAEIGATRTSSAQGCLPSGRHSTYGRGRRFAAIGIARRFSQGCSHLSHTSAASRLRWAGAASHALIWRPLEAAPPLSFPMATALVNCPSFNNGRTPMSITAASWCVRDRLNHLAGPLSGAGRGHARSGDGTFAHSAPPRSSQFSSGV